MLKSKKMLLLVSSGILLALAVFCGIYLSTGSYQAKQDAAAALAGTETYTIKEYDDGTLAFVSPEPTAGLIFYPGGKVEPKSYAPLMAAFAQEGVLCVLLDPPFNLAVFDRNAADGIQEQYPEIKHWYIAGHSLGGAMAASYVSKHSEDYEGLFLMASYSTENLKESNLEVVSLYGSEDLILNMEKYRAYRTNLPDSAEEYVLDGGCHAGFGSYGTQDGDGIPTITTEEQIQMTVAQCMSIIEK